MIKDHLPWIIAGAAVITVLVAGLLVARLRAHPDSPLRGRRRRPPRSQFRSGEQPPTPPKRAAVVVNPTKFVDLALVKERITAACVAEGWAEPLFLETTIEDPGHGQAKAALAEGVQVVCSLGGDGTVRSVASALVGSETPLGLLPAGTGNLLARNLDLPMDSIETAVRVALTGRNRRIDVGEVVVGPEDTEHPDERERHIFLVMSGMGMDAAIMAGTNENLKRTVGWPAYMLSGARNLVSPEYRASITLDHEPEFRRRARFVIIGNCGRLLGGLVLMPNARVDDDRLDVVFASPKGIVGWVPVAMRVVTRQRKGHSTLDHKVCRNVRVRTERPMPIQIDGDVMGESTEVSATVRPGVLTVRVSQD